MVSADESWYRSKATGFRGSDCVDDTRMFSDRAWPLHRSGVGGGGGVPRYGARHWRLPQCLVGTPKSLPISPGKSTAYARNLSAVSNLVFSNNPKLQMEVAMPLSISKYLIFHYFLRHPKERPPIRPFDTLLPSNASLPAKGQSARLP